MKWDRVLWLRSTDHARIEALSNSFGLGLGLKISIENISPWSLDGVLLRILSSHIFVQKLLFRSISSNPLDSSLALAIAFFRICLVQFIKIRRQILGCIPTVLPAALS